MGSPAAEALVAVTVRLMAAFGSSTSGSSPRLLIETPDGVKYFDVVSLSACPSRNGITVCTEPLPNVRSPDQRRAAVVAQRAGDDLGARCGPAIDEHDDRRAVECIARGRIHLEPRIGRAAFGADDHARVDELVRHVGRGLQHAARIAAQVEHETAQTERPAGRSDASARSRSAGVESLNCVIRTYP